MMRVHDTTHDGVQQQKQQTPRLRLRQAACCQHSLYLNIFFFICQHTLFFFCLTIPQSWHGVENLPRAQTVQAWYWRSMAWHGIVSPGTWLWAIEIAPGMGLVDDPGCWAIRHIFPPSSREMD